MRVFIEYFKQANVSISFLLMLLFPYRLNHVLIGINTELSHPSPKHITVISPRPDLAGKITTEHSLERAKAASKHLKPKEPANPGSLPSLCYGQTWGPISEVWATSIKNVTPVGFKTFDSRGHGVYHPKDKYL